MEFYTLQSQAIQNAFADANADYAAGAVACGFKSFSCPVQPVIFASAFAQSTFEVGPDNAVPAGAVSPYVKTYPTDFYAYMGQLTVNNERTPFPPWTPAGLLTTAAPPAGLQNMNVFSLHSYGKTGFQLYQLGYQTASAIANARPQPVATSPLTLPYAVTEHAAHTTVVWDATNSHADTDFESSRLAGQILYQMLNGFEAYIFKFSSAEQSQAIIKGCSPYAAANGATAGAFTPCGAQKARRRRGLPAVVPPCSPSDAAVGAGGPALGRQLAEPVSHPGHDPVCGVRSPRHLQYGESPPLITLQSSNHTLRVLPVRSAL